MDAVKQNNFEVANKILKEDDKWEKQERNKLLFYLNKGTVLWMQGDFANSNIYFGKADLFVEDFQKNYGQAFLSLLVNPNVMTYPGENFEQILIHYYGALNYLALNQYDDALVEGKRMLEKMQRVTDKYQSKNKYKRDAFAHNLLGIIYDAKGDYNDAFIAYRNAYEVYRDDYQTQMGTPIPEQLKLDLLRTAYFTGFYDDVRKYEAEFKMTFDRNTPRNSSQLVFFWNNGMCPVKDQNTMTFTIVPLTSGWVEFIHMESGLHFPFYVGKDDDKKRKDLLDMKIVRIAIPKFVRRDPYYHSATALTNGMSFNFNLAEDVNAIAFKSLEDRMLKELGEALLRVALKQLSIAQARKDEKNKGLAFAATLYSAFSEQADTRNWQLLPYSINYCRMPLKEGNQTVSFYPSTQNGEKGLAKNFEVHALKGQTKFLAVQTMQFKGYSQ